MRTYPWVYAVVERDDATHKLFVKVVNANSTELRLPIDLTGISKVSSEATLTAISGKTPNATNGISHPDEVMPVAHKIAIAGPKFTETFAPYSVNVLELSY